MPCVYYETPDEKREYAERQDKGRKDQLDKMARVACLALTLLEDLSGNLKTTVGKLKYSRNGLDEINGNELARQMIDELGSTNRAIDAVLQNSELEQWWDDHKKADAQALQKKFEDKAKRRASVLSKLSKEDRDALGI
jgi:hypothetical protein